MAVQAGARLDGELAALLLGARCAVAQVLHVCQGALQPLPQLLHLVQDMPHTAA